MGSGIEEELIAILKMAYTKVEYITKNLVICDRKCIIDIRSMETVIEDNGTRLYFNKMGDRISYVRQGYRVSFFDKLTDTKICDVDAEYNMKNVGSVTTSFGEYTKVQLSKNSLMIINTKTAELEHIKM